MLEDQYLLDELGNLETGFSGDSFHLNTLGEEINGKKEVLFGPPNVVMWAVYSATFSNR